jgi:hypothetical protein
VAWAIGNAWASMVDGIRPLALTATVRPCGVGNVSASGEREMLLPLLVGSLTTRVCLCACLQRWLHSLTRMTSGRASSVTRVSHT